MTFDISLDKINEAKAKKQEEAALKQKRVVRTGMSMQQTALAAMNKNLIPADYAGASQQNAPKYASTQTPQ